ncbi:MAG: SDR family oxidoreductase [Candidatus Omnitrophota bacterium]
MRPLNELKNLRGRVAIVTGGTGHAGSAIAEALAESGAAVVIIGRDKLKCRYKAEDISRRFHVAALPLAIDLEDEYKIRQINKKVLREFGRVDILVNCAAILTDSRTNKLFAPFEAQDTISWRKAIEVNLTAAFVLTQACREVLELSGKGSVINISSIYGISGPDMRLYKGTKMGNSAAYAASKGGLVQLTRWLATVLAPRVRVNAISSGGIFRNQDKRFIDRYVARTPLRRMASEEDLKGAAIYLASDLSAYVTGHNLIVDGGWTVW